MNKTFKKYTLCWLIMLTVFNMACFATPNEYAGLLKFGGAFWSGYICIILAYAGQLACAYYVFKAENAQKLFYHLPLMTISYMGLVFTVIVGGLCMAVPNLPNWVGVVVCVLILAFHIIAVTKVSIANNLITEIDEKTNVQTKFIKTTTTDIQNLMEKTKSDMAREKCKKVWEVLRYSDPVSCDALSDIEGKMTVKINELEKAVVKEENKKITTIANEIIFLANERNKKCRELK